MTWYNSGYGYKKQITQDHTKVSTANQSSFPMEVSFTDANLKTTGNGGRVTNSSGFDIIFTDSTETTKLDHEIEKYVASTGEIVMHVRIPTLSSSADTIIYMYYGNSSISSSQENVTGVWDSNYKAVFHLSDNAANTTVKESTSNGNTGTAVANTSTKTVAGQIASGLTFNGTSDDVATTNAPTTATNNFTVSCWVKPGSINQGPALFVYNGNDSGGYGPAIGGAAGAGTGAKLLVLIGGVVWFDSGFMFSSTTAWVKIDVVRNAGTLAVYANGSQTANTTGSSPLSVQNAFQIGNEPGFSRFVNALIDEVRISSTARSAGWITTEYNNQSSPSTFYSVGSEIPQPVSLSVTFAGIGALNPALSASLSLPSTTLAGTGTLSGTISRSASLSTTLTGQGSLVPTLSANLALPSVTIVGTSTLAATPALSTSLSTTLAGIGALNPALSASMSLGSATLAGQGTLSTTPSLSTALAAPLDGVGVLSAVLSAAMSLSAQFDGTSAFSANPTLSTDLAVEFDGTSSLLAALSTSNTAALMVTTEGQGALSGALSLAMDLAASLDGFGAITALLSLVTELFAEFDGTSTLDATPSLSTDLTASFDGSGEITATLHLATNLSANLAGQGSLSATLSTDNTASLAVTMAGQSSLVATGNYSMKLAPVSLDGSSSLTANTVFTTSLTVAMSGQGALSGSMDLAIALAAVLAGQGTLSGSLSVPVMLSVIFAGYSTLFGNLVGPPMDLKPNITLYVRTGNATLYTREGNITLYERGE